MRQNKRFLKRSRLYLVLDTQVQPYDKLLKVLKKAVCAGVDIIQLRDKEGCVKDILKFTQQALKYVNNRCLFIVNDRVDIALAAGAHGVHLGQDDLPVATVRKMVGSKMIIGASCQTLAHARKAQAEGADYIGFGSVFKTLTKPERAPMKLKLLSRVVKEVQIPVFAIGGINTINAIRLKDLGVDRIAVTRVISLADNVERTVKEFNEILM